MKGLIKIKLSFDPGINTKQRIETLMTWSKRMIKTEDFTVVETQHFTNMSFIVIRKSRSINNF